MPPSSPPISLHRRQRWRSWRTWVWGALAVALAVAVFGLYAQPDFMVMLADQMWACF